MNFNYRDIHAAFDAGGYTMTNEEPETFRAILERLRKGGERFRRIGGICSGGEMPFFAFLPHADEVIAIDHGKLAIATTWMKALFLGTYGKDTLQAGKEGKWKSFCTENKHTLPAELAKAVEQAYTIPDYTSFSHEWGIVPPAIMEESGKRINSLTLLHGDLSDLKPWAPLDVLYVSNAHGHSNRHKTTPTIESVIDLVKLWGYILIAGPITSDKIGPGLVQVENIRGKRTSGWTHEAWQKVR